MSDKPEELARIQGWMQAVITHPSGIRAGIASAAARQQIDARFEDIETIVSPSKALTGAERLMIYSRSYHARLLECFRAEFPCLLYALGKAVFDDFVIEYLKQHPPESYTLKDVAKSFPQFLAETRPATESWPDFIIDLARLERTFIEVFDGPGGEGKKLARADQILALDDERLARLRLTPVACLRLLAFRYPVLSYFNAVRAKKEPDLPTPSETFLAVNRIDYLIHFSPLSASQHAVLESLVAGLSVADALTRAADRAAADRAAADRKLLEGSARAWLRDWVDGGFFLH
ncbi:MAG TPA: putative DNA-binding domain-containing protein [Blastocatellia bacterium]|nr:putative DNA-binding domain-containing protein [Blastocatellia bacterium]